MRWEKPSRRAKMECLPAFHSGPTGALGFPKLGWLQFKFRAWVSYPCFLGGYRRRGAQCAPGVCGSVSEERARTARPYERPENFSPYFVGAAISRPQAAKSPAKT